MADMDGHDEDLDEFQDVADVVVEGDETQPVAADDPFELLYKHHPETILDYVESIVPEVPLQAAPPTEDGSKDSRHRSPPFLTVYERTKILGARTNQLAEGAMPFVAVPEYMTQPLEIAKLELEQRRLPYIIKRPMPDGTFEYWRLSDLMIL
jgi:DNA-directed RNA polymerase I, II, and III subunit RPABC2